MAADGSGKFPAGMSVLVVDDDPLCLMILDRMLKRCKYQATTCRKATTALAMLRENQNKFDLVLSDVHMPDMDGFKLLELVGLEMDLPVIMMSADGDTSLVMKGINHGACNYLIKPVRLEEVKNLWQHVLRRKRTDFEKSRTPERPPQLEEVTPDEIEVQSKIIEEPTESGTGGNYHAPVKKRKKLEPLDIIEEEAEGPSQEEDLPSFKKTRIVWSLELHQQFVDAVNSLGIEKAVPKRILEIMKVPGLMRENVASHLQKYRLYLRKLSSVHQDQPATPKQATNFPLPLDLKGASVPQPTAIDLMQSANLQQLNSVRSFGLQDLETGPGLLEQLAKLQEAQQQELHLLNQLSQGGVLATPQANLLADLHPTLGAQQAWDQVDDSFAGGLRLPEQLSILQKDGGISTGLERTGSGNTIAGVRRQ